MGTAKTQIPLSKTSRFCGDASSGAVLGGAAPGEGLLPLAPSRNIPVAPPSGENHRSEGAGEYNRRILCDSAESAYIEAIPSLNRRLWRRVDKSNVDGCWIWRGSRCSGGYGQLRLSGRDGRRIGAHRASLLIATGAIRTDLEVLHACDNKLCVNPAHLSQDTHQRNMSDAARAGLMNKPRRRLLPDEVVALRAELLAGRESVFEIAKRYGTAYQNAYLHRRRALAQVQP